MCVTGVIGMETLSQTPRRVYERDTHQSILRNPPNLPSKPLKTVKTPQNPEIKRRTVMPSALAELFSCFKIIRAVLSRYNVLYEQMLTKVDVSSRIPTAPLIFSFNKELWSGISLACSGTPKHPRVYKAQEWRHAECLSSTCTKVVTRRSAHARHPELPCTPLFPTCNVSHLSSSTY